MKVLLIAADFPPLVGGVATFGVGLAQSLIDGGHSVTILTSVPPTGGFQPPSDLHILRLPRGFDRKLLKVLPLTLVGMWQCLMHRPDRVIAMTWAHEGITAYILHLVLRVPFMIIAHGSELLERGERGRFVMRHVFSRAMRIVANSGYTAELIRRLGIDCRQAVIYYPPVPLPRTAVGDATKYVDTYGLRGKRIIITVGRLVARKGHDDVLKALALLKDRYPALVYIIVGSGEREAFLRELAASLGVECQTIFAGYVSDEALDAFYKLCDVFVLPARQEGSDIEGFGIAFVEAALRAKPVIGGRTGGVTEVVVEGETGLLVEPNNPTELADKLSRLMDDRDLRHQLGTQGRELALRRFTSKGQRDRLEGALAHP